MNYIAKLLAGHIPGKKRFRYHWVSNQSKNPSHLTFNEGARISYMRDGILTLTDGVSGTYERVREWGGENRDSHEVVFCINARIFNGEAELSEIENDSKTTFLP